VKTTREGIFGEKICCNPLESVVYDGPNKNVVACPGASIFMDRTSTYDATIVNDYSSCGINVCEFYPADGFVIKLDVYGEIARGEKGQPLIVKPCTPKRKVGRCDRGCGGGKRVVTGTDMYCNNFSMTEICNPEPCFVETVAN